MATEAKVSIVVLWESELRAAGQALVSITADSKKESKLFSEQVIAALNACSVALAGLSMDKDAPVVLLMVCLLPFSNRHALLSTSKLDKWPESQSRGF
jgi:hypothetical protein